ncbi:MAG: hypothetical protein OHK0013_07400 [Sandaracinaceae bacterium]
MDPRLALPLFVLGTSLAPTTARADAPFAASPDEAGLAAEHPFGFGVYVSGWLGSYAAAGVGGRLRWEPFDELGVEVFGEAHYVDHAPGLRHDHQLGFDLYVPIRLGAGFRLRPLFGFCVVISMIEPVEQHAPRADDVLFGAHAGVGLEWSANEWLALFVEAQGTGWMGHDRSTERWTGAISDTYVPFGTAQVILGASAHFGD